MQTSRSDELISDGLERISETARFLGVSRSHVYRLIQEGVLPSVKIGKSRRVPVRAVRELVLNKMVIVSETETKQA
jgi:excisionase family DNA binding protein